MGSEFEEKKYTNNHFQTRNTTFREIARMISSGIIRRDEKLLPAGMIKKSLTFQIRLRRDPKTTLIKASL